MPSTPEEKKRVLARVRRIRGQVEALERALTEDAECAAVLQQIAAVRGAVGGLMSHVLDDHIQFVVANASTEAERAAAVREVSSTIRSYLK